MKSLLLKPFQELQGIGEGKLVPSSVVVKRALELLELLNDLPQATALKQWLSGRRPETAVVTNVSNSMRILVSRKVHPVCFNYCNTNNVWVRTDRECSEGLMNTMVSLSTVSLLK